MKKLAGKVYIKILAIVMLIISVLYIFTATYLIMVSNNNGLYDTATDEEFEYSFRNSVFCSDYASFNAMKIAHYYYNTLDQTVIPDEYSLENTNLEFVKIDSQNNVATNSNNIEAYMSWNTLNYGDINLYYKIQSPLQAKDSIYHTFNFIKGFVNLYFFVLFLIILSVVVVVVSFVYLMYSSGHRDNSDKIALNPIDKVPLEIYILGGAAIIIFVVFILAQFTQWYSYNGSANNTVDFTFIVFLIYSSISIITLILLSFCMTLSTRVKKNTLYKNTLIYYLFGWLFRSIKLVFKNIALVWKVILLMAVITIVNLFILSSYSDLSFIFYLMINALITLFLCVVAIQLEQLKKAGSNIAGGNINYRVNTSKMFGSLKQHGNDLNNINEGLSKALDERIKSERLKTELITNVSHDIKTPLTSIINYVDLLKKENIPNDKVKEYLDVLDRQSIRLKKLTNDVVEASKVTTGNIPVNFEQLDLCELLNQSIGEYEQKLEQNNLQLVVSMPDEKTPIVADGKLLWRVFDNVFNNIEKYAQQHTRVYLSVTKSNGVASIEFKNISKFPLNFSPDELMERFVRGDISRTTEGSGLGLSIAKSLTDLQNGSFNIFIDGDLFKVVLAFYILRKEDKTNEQFSNI